MLMEMLMKENGKTTRHMAMVFIFIRMGPSMKETGMKINSTEKEKNYGLMARLMKVTINKVKKRGRDCLLGVIKQIITESFMIIIFTG